MGQGCGEGLWCRTVGWDYGSGTVGPDCGAGHCCLECTQANFSKLSKATLTQEFSFVLSLSPVGFSKLIITQMLTFGCSFYLLPYSFSILTILTRYHIVAF